VLPGSATARVIGGDAERAVATNGYAVPPRTCTFGTPPTDFMQPPVQLNASRVVKPHFYTDGATLRDPYGAPFLVRGVNNSHAWYDICGQYAAFGALEALAKTGANSVRIGWAFHSIDPGGPGSDAPEKSVIGTHPLLLAEILHRALALKLVPIITFNDSTGQTDSAWPIKMAQLITAPGYKQVFQAYEPFILLGIANEWNGADFTAAYTPAVATLRNAALKLPLVITGNAWGQGCKPIIDGAPALIQADPQHNLLFDLHIYTYISYPLPGASNTEAGGEPPRVAACLDEIAAYSIPLVVGEFGESHSSGAVAWQTIIARADANQQGYVPWVWYGDTEYRQLNMNQRWSGPLTAWGKQAVSGFARTAKRATLFR
jgi:mannan endo-1,4-beta-mannosidase